NSFRFRLSESFRLRFAAALCHCLGEICEEHREPKPNRDLRVEGNVGRIAPKQQHCRQQSAKRDHKHHRIFCKHPGVEFPYGIEQGPAHDRRIEQRPRSLSRRKNWIGRGCEIQGKDIGQLLQFGVHDFSYEMRCSTIGPSDKAGRNVRAPTMMITPTRSATNSGPWVGRVPAEAGICFFRASEPAMASKGRSMKKRPISMAKPVVMLYQGVLARNPAKALPLLPVALVYAYRISEKPCAPGLARFAVAGPTEFQNPFFGNGATEDSAEKIRMLDARIRSASIAIFTSFCSIFLPRYSGVRPTIRPAIKTARMANISMP